MSANDGNVVILNRDWADEAAANLLPILFKPNADRAQLHRVLASSLRVAEAQGAQRGAKEAGDAYAAIFEKGSAS